MAGRHRLRSALAAITTFGVVAYPLLAVAAFVPYLLTTRRTRPWPFVATGSLIVVTLVLSALFSGWTLPALVGSGGALLLGAGLFAVWTRTTERDLVPMFLGIAAGMAAQLLLSLWQLYFVGAQRASGLTFHPNVLGSIAATCALALCGGALAGPRFLPRRVSLGGFVLSMAALLATGSRGALLGLLAGLLALAVVGASRSRQGLPSLRLLYPVLITGLAVLAVIVLFPGVAEPLTRRTATLAATLDDRSRLQLWAIALDIARHSPFLGYGFGAWSQLAPQAEPAVNLSTWPSSHDLYLELLLDGGTLLLTAFVALAVSMASRFVTAYRGLEHGWPALMALGVLAGTMTTNVFDVLLYQPQLQALLWLILGMGAVTTAALE